MLRCQLDLICSQWESCSTDAKQGKYIVDFVAYACENLIPGIQWKLHIYLLLHLVWNQQSDWSSILDELKISQVKDNRAFPLYPYTNIWLWQTSPVTECMNEGAAALYLSTNNYSEVILEPNEANFPLS